MIPKKKIPSLSSLRTFDIVASHRSFKAAAEELGVTPTAVSHQIRQLEEALGTDVLKRSPREVNLTAAGIKLKEATTSAFDLLMNAIASVQQTKQSSSVSLTSTANFVSNWLLPRLKNLQLSCPDIDLKLHASDHILDLRKDEIDIAIRYTLKIDESLNYRFLYSDQFALVCSPALPLTSLDSLKDLPLIHVDGRIVPSAIPDWEAWRDSWGPKDLTIKTGIHFSEETHAIQAAINGQGVAIVSQLMAKNALQKGLLYEPFKFRLPGGIFYFVTTKDKAERNEIQNIYHWFEAQLNID